MSQRLMKHYRDNNVNESKYNALLLDWLTLPMHHIHDMLPLAQWLMGTAYVLTKNNEDNNVKESEYYALLLGRLTLPTD